MENHEIQDLKNQLTALQNQLDQLEAAGDPERASRRNMLRLAGGAAVGAIAGGLAFGARPASAGVSTPLNLNETNTPSAPTIISKPGAGYTSVGLRGLFHLTDNLTAGNAASAVSLLSMNSSSAGVVGIVSSVQPSSGVGYGAKLDAPVPLKLLDSGNSSATLPNTGYKGQFRVHDGNLYFCVANGNLGANPTWRRVTGPTVAGGFVAIAPIRAYDSRKTAYASTGVLAPNSSRVISVADAHNSEGAVTTANAIPSGANAVAYNITATGATGGNFLSVNPGDATDYTASTVNFASGLDIANASVVKLDSSRQIKVFCGGDVGSAHVIIDIGGYYL